LPHVSISKALGFALSFSFRNAAAIAARIALPALAGWVVLYVSLFLYLKELAGYMSDPSDRIAGLVLGLAAAGLLVTLFLHSVIVAAVTALALGLEDGNWKYFHAAKREWRLYAANLRLLLVVGIWIGAVLAVEFAAAKLSWPVHLRVALDVVMAGGLGVLAIRAWFLAAPVSVARTQGRILRRAWQLSASDAWRLAAIVAVLLLTGFAIEMAGEFVMRAGGMIPPFPSPGSLADYVAVFRKVLPGFLIAVGVAYVVGNTLLTGARAYVYRRLTEDTEP
jgi:hypothetical protein